jgi:hypothetical protein
MNIHVQFGFNHICSSEKKAFEHFPIGFNVNLCIAVKFLFFMPIGNPRWPPPQDID